MARMHAARQRGLVNRQHREGFTPEQTRGRAFAQLISAGAGLMGSNENLAGMANQRPASAGGRTRFANVPPLNLDPLRDGKENASAPATPSKKPPSRTSSVGAGLSMGVSLAATRVKTQELAKDMMLSLIHI